MMISVGGNGTTSSTVSAEDPAMSSPALAVIWTSPGERAVSMPPTLTCAMLASLLDQVTVVPWISVPDASNAWASNASRIPAKSDADPVTVTLATGAALTGVSLQV